MERDFTALEKLVVSAFYEGKQPDEMFTKICTLHDTMQGPQGADHTFGRYDTSRCSYSVGCSGRCAILLT